LIAVGSAVKQLKELRLMLLQAWQARRQSTKKYNTYQLSLMTPDDGLLASPKHVEV
jgi:hypothetical protein